MFLVSVHEHGCGRKRRVNINKTDFSLVPIIQQVKKHIQIIAKIKFVISITVYGCLRIVLIERLR